MKQFLAIPYEEFWELRTIVGEFNPDDYGYTPTFCRSWEEIVSVIEKVEHLPVLSSDNLIKGVHFPIRRIVETKTLDNKQILISAIEYEAS